MSDRQAGAAVLPKRRRPDGKPARDRSQDRQNERNREAVEDAQSVVLAQPHRQGFHRPEDALLGSAIGRFVVRHRMAVEIVDAAEVYAAAKRKWLSIKGAPLETRMGGSGADVDAEIVAKWRDTWRGIETSIASVAGMNALSWITAAAMRDTDIPENQHTPQIKRGLVELGYAAGKLERPR